MTTWKDYAGAAEAAKPCAGGGVGYNFSRYALEVI